MRIPSSVTAALLASWLLVSGLAGCSPADSGDGGSAGTMPVPAQDASLARQPGSRTAVFAGGCFWGMQWVFEHVKGVQNVTSGYSGGNASTAHYEQVGEGDTGHAESIRVRYDPSTVTYGQLLRVYFSVATDPTELDRQGPDVGSQYRSVLFYADPQQRHVAEAYIRQLTAAKAFADPIVTRVEPLRGFYPAEAYHQDYARLHPHALYIVINDAPKVDRLRDALPALYRAEPVRYSR